MKNKIKPLLITFLLFILMSCDPPHNIDIINNTNSEAKVKFNLNPRVKNYRLEEIAKGDSIVFNLKEKDTANLYFGIGTWDDKEIDGLCKSISSLEIETNDVKTVYKSKRSIKKILHDNQEGFWWKTLIKIEIE